MIHDRDAAANEPAREGGPGGWIKVHRKLRDSIAGSSAIATGVWVHLLLRAAYRPVVLRNGRTLQPGEVLISEVSFAADLGVSRKVMRRLIALFVAERMIEVLKRDRNGTHLSICRWATYQDSREQKGQQRDSNGIEREQKGNTEKKVIKIEERTEPPPLPPPRVPPAAAETEATEGGEGEVGWSDVTERLRRLGVVAAAEAIASARRGGATLAMVWAAVEGFAEAAGAWEPGLLYARIAALAPGIDPLAHLPPPAPEHARQRAAAERDAQRRRRDADRAAKQQQREAQRAAEAELERRWGPAVDALQRERAEAILRDENPLRAADYIRRWQRGSPVTGAARSLLLLALRDAALAEEVAT